MGKRKPNHYGCVTRLKGNRSRPWIVKVTTYDEKGIGRQVPIGYAETEEQGNILLAQYNDNPWDVNREKVTFADLYARWCEVKLPHLSLRTQQCMKSAYKHCSKLYGMKYRQIKAYHMQDCIDNCGHGYATQGSIKTLFGNLDKFAFELDLIDKMYSQVVSATPIPDTTREPFTNDQIDALWKIKDEAWVDSVLIFIYTGFRLNELLGMKVDQINLKERYFQGGEKTTAGKDRIVPIHSKILAFVQNRLNQSTTYFFTETGSRMSATQYHRKWKEVMKKIGADDKTPHEARHTFETNLDNAQANKKCIDLLMGHKSPDVGTRIYNHKTLEQLRETIELLK